MATRNGGRNNFVERANGIISDSNDIGRGEGRSCEGFIALAGRIHSLGVDYADAAQRGDQDPVEESGAGTPSAEVSNALIITRRRANQTDCITEETADRLQELSEEYWDHLEDRNHTDATQSVSDYSEVLEQSASESSHGTFMEASERIGEVREIMEADAGCEVVGEELQTLVLYFLNNRHEILSMDDKRRSRLAGEFGLDLMGSFVQDHLESCVGRQESLDIQENLSSLQQAIDHGSEDIIRRSANDTAADIREDFGIPFPGDEDMGGGGGDSVPPRNIKCFSAPQEDDLVDAILEGTDGDNEYPTDISTTTDARGDLVACLILEEILEE